MYLRALQLTPLTAEEEIAYAAAVRQMIDQCDVLVGLSGGKTVQGTQEWKDARIKREVDGKSYYCIGGSEIYKLDSPADRQSLLTDKLNNISSGSTLAARSNDELSPMQWGKITEELTRQHVQGLLKIEIFEVDASIVHATNPHFRYSPDGIGVVRMLTATNDKEFGPVVFEFKNPYKRRASRSSKNAVSRIEYEDIPNKYLSQIYSGPDTLTFAVGTIYAEANWCAQSLDDYATRRARYQRHLHFMLNLNASNPKLKKPFEGLELITSRMVGFMMPMEPFVQMSGAWLPQYEMYNLAEFSQVYFESFLAMTLELKCFVYAPSASANEEIAYLKSQGCTAFLPLGMFRFGMRFIPRQEAYIELNYSKKIAEFMAVLESRLALLARSKQSFDDSLGC